MCFKVWSKKNLPCPQPEWQLSGQQHPDRRMDSQAHWNFLKSDNFTQTFKFRPLLIRQFYQISSPDFCRIPGNSASQKSECRIWLVLAKIKARRVWSEFLQIETSDLVFLTSMDLWLYQHSQAWSSTATVELLMTDEVRGLFSRSSSGWAAFMWICGHLSAKLSTCITELRNLKTSGKYFFFLRNF